MTDAPSSYDLRSAVNHAIERLSQQTDAAPLEQAIRVRPGDLLLDMAHEIREYTALWSDLLGWNLAVAGVLARGTLDATAALRGQVMALWQRLGDLLGLITRQGGFQYPEDQLTIRWARQLHDAIKTEDKPCNEKSRSSR